MSQVCNSALILVLLVNTLSTKVLEFPFLLVGTADVCFSKYYLKNLSFTQVCFDPTAYSHIVCQNIQDKLILDVYIILA